MALISVDFISVLKNVIQQKDKFMESYYYNFLLKQ